MIKKEDLGKKLTEAQADKKKIVLHVSMRTLLVLIITLAGVKGINGLIEWFSSWKTILMFFLLFIPSLLWGLFPLTHLKDKLKFYELGMSINGHIYLYQDIGMLTFYDYTYGIKTEQYIKSNVKNFNVTYIYRPKRYYNKDYLNND